MTKEDRKSTVSRSCYTCQFYDICWFRESVKQLRSKVWSFIDCLDMLGKICKKYKEEVKKDE